MEKRNSSPYLWQRIKTYTMTKSKKVLIREEENYSLFLIIKKTGTRLDIFNYGTGELFELLGEYTEVGEPFGKVEPFTDEEAELVFNELTSAYNIIQSI